MQSVSSLSPEEFSKMNAKILLILLIVGICLEYSRAKNIAGNDCSKDCNTEECPVPEGCLAGMTKDHCDCCMVCGRREGERCFNETLRSKVNKDSEHYGECGDGLECRLRTDLSEEDAPEAICFCEKVRPICASDGVTYANECQLTEERYKRRNNLVKVDDSPCLSKPEIVSPPEDLTEAFGESISFTCEAKGWPIPAIDWKVVTDGIEMPLPSDNPNISVQSRGGPNEFEMTSWLQISSVESKHAGHYACVAHNSQGETRHLVELILGNFRKRSHNSSSGQFDDEL